MRKLLQLLVPLAFFFILWAEVMSATLHVPATYGTIQAAITASVDGDTILVAAGTYFENDIYLEGKEIVLIGEQGKVACVK